MHFELHQCLMNGGFSTQIGNSNPFGWIPMDQTIPMIVNEDA